MTALLAPAGGPYAPFSLDPEGLALTKDRELIFTSEGLPNSPIDPFVRRYGLDGSFLGSLAVPPPFLVTDDPSSGVHPNLGSESAGVPPNGRFAFVGTENALFQDGPAATIANGSPARILRYHLPSGCLDRQWVYLTDPVAEPPVPATEFPVNGLVELLPLNNELLIAMERSFPVGALEGSRDHFGFADGIAQPAVEGSGVAPRPGDGRPDGRGRWRPVRTGGFLHGYEDEDGLLPAAPAAPFDRNGTFMVYRRLHMDVAAFRRFVADVGREFPAARSRWPPSSSAAGPTARRSCAHKGSATSPTRTTRTARSARGAHIPRANPRDAPGFFDGRLSNRHRIIRRDRPYGPPLPPGSTEDDGVDRGPVFVCFNDSIWRRFETVQALWIDDGDPFGLGADKDFLAGEPHGTAGTMTIQGHPPFFIRPQPRFVTMRGGEYLFRPSMSGLRFLAGG